jgi:hypothetical protein
MAQSATRATVPNMTAAQSAYTLETGDTIVVETTQRPAGANASNLEQEHLVIQVRAWKAAPDGTQAKDSRGKPLEIPVKMCSIMHSALAEGTLDLGSTLAGFTTDALTRARTWIAVQAQIEQLPTSTQ